jgi:hypothetical protein
MLGTPQHEALYQDLIALMRKYGTDGMTSIEMLAVSANMTGKVLAMQDQRITTVEKAMKVVLRNIELGNQQVIESLRNGPAKGRS